MTATNFYRLKGTKPVKGWVASRSDSTVRVRLQIRAFQQSQSQPMISNLMLDHGLTVNVLRVMGTTVAERQEWLDVELIGTIQQIQNGIAYLESLNLSLRGKPNVDGDGWHC